MGKFVYFHPLIFFQPPTPSTTPGPGSVPQQHQNFLGIIPELLQESIDNLQGTDEGLASTSSPATPIQTPHSPTLSHQSEGGRNHQVVLPEQLAAGTYYQRPILVDWSLTFSV